MHDRFRMRLEALRQQLDRTTEELHQSYETEYRLPERDNKFLSSLLDFQKTLFDVDNKILDIQRTHLYHIEQAPWLRAWGLRGDDMPCPVCGQAEIETQDNTTVCRHCGWQQPNPVAQEGK